MRLPLTLNLHLTRTWTRTWRVEETSTINGRLAERQGAKAQEGWHFGWKNGLARFEPFSRLYSLEMSGDLKVTGKKARQAKKLLERKSPTYLKERRGRLAKGFAYLVDFPLSLLALLVTLLTFPVYLALWVVWVIVALFYMLLMLAFGKLLSKAIIRLLTPTR